MTSAIYEDDLARNEAASQKKKNCVSDILGLSMAFQRIRRCERFKILLVLPFGGQNETRRHRIYANLGRQFERQHLRDGQKRTFAEMVRNVSAVIVGDT